MNLLNTVQNTIRKNSLFNQNDTLLLSFSAGIDSVCLLDCLIRLNYTNIILFYVDHQIRPANEIDEDKRVLSYYALKHNLVYKVKKIPILQYTRFYRLSAEIIGHLIRKHLLQHYAKLFKVTTILTAHHYDDVAETVILNMLRGSFYSSGLSVKNNISTIQVARPLYNANKKSIQTYCNYYNLQFNQDSTNSDMQYKRNFVRHKLIPLLHSHSNTFCEDLTSVYDQWHENLNYNRQKYNKDNLVLTNKEHYYECDITPILRCSNFDLNRWVSQLIFALYDALFKKNRISDVLNRYVVISQKHVAEIVTAIAKKKFGKVIILPRNVNVLYHERHLFFYKEGKLDDIKENKTLNLHSSISFRNTKWTYLKIKQRPKHLKSSSNHCFVSIDEKVICIRYAKKEDTITPFSRNSKINLFDYLKKRKFNRLQRLTTLVACVDNEVIWVPGVCIDDRYKINETSSVFAEIKIHPLTDTIKDMISYK